MPSLNESFDARETEEKKACNAFEKLVQDIRDTLGPSSGIDSANINPNDLQRLMENYVSNPSEWLKYAFKDYSRSYTRNLVDEGNGRANILMLVWTPGKTSPIHDHASAHCIMKILKGTLKETLYDWPDATRVMNGEPSPLKITKETIFQTNEATYMSDQLGLHSVGNPDPENIAISLHLYTPPNAARYGCHIFDEQTGKASHIIQCNYFSRLGQKVI